MTAKLFLEALLDWQSRDIPQAEVEAWESLFNSLPEDEKKFVAECQGDDILLLCCSPETDLLHGTTRFSREDGTDVIIPPGVNALVQAMYDYHLDGVLSSIPTTLKGTSPDV